MLVRQKKLTLHTPYNKINEVLWQSKRLNSQQLTQNTQLKTHVQQVQRRTRDNGNQGQLSRKLMKKYQKLAQTFKNQANLIQSINSQIQERNYEQLKDTVKKIENKLNTTAIKALKLEKKLKLKMKRGNVQYGCSNNAQIYEENTTINTLEQETKNLEQKLQKKERKLIQVQVQNKELNRQLINLLAIKNKLREEYKETTKNNRKMQLPKCQSKDKLAKTEK